MSKKYNIKMLKTLTGADDGIKVKEYAKDSEYVVGESLFNSFKKMEACKLCAVKKVKENPAKENKEA